MQKKMMSLTLALVLAFSMAVSASAATPRYNSLLTAAPSLSFSGTTANCKVSITADKGSSIDLDMYLYRVDGSEETLLQSWSTSGTTSMNYSGTCKVSKGSYRLTAEVYVDGPGGTDSVSKSVTASCRG